MDVWMDKNSAEQMMAFDEIEGARKVLTSGGLALLPTDTVWCLGCSIFDQKSYDRMLLLKDRLSPFGPEIVVDSLKRLKAYIPGLHPKLETLLIYHTRPLTILFPQKHGFPAFVNGSASGIAVRVATDPFCKALIQAIDAPIITSFASSDDNDYPKSFGMISSSILKSVDYVARYQQKEKVQHMPAVVIQLSDKEEVIFLRE